MKMKRITIVIMLTALLLISLCSCRERIILSKQDEFTMSNWKYSGEYGMSAYLKFSDTKAEFTVYENDKITVSIKGYYRIDDESITITDEKILCDIVFKYRIMGDTAELVYESEKIIMNRADATNN